MTVVKSKLTYDLRALERGKSDGHDKFVGMEITR